MVRARYLEPNSSRVLIFGSGLPLGEVTGATPPGFLEVAHGLFGFVFATLGFEESHGFWDVHAGDDCVEQWQRADGQRPAPAPVAGVRDHEVADHGGDDPADGPERFQQHSHAAALFGRRKLGDQRGGDRQFRAQAQSDDQSGAEQHAE